MTAAWKPRRALRRFQPGIVFLLPLLALAQAYGEPAVRFVHISDTHVMDLRGAHPNLIEARKHYAQSAAALESFLKREARQLRPAFVLHTGDIVDAFMLSGPDGQPLYGQIERFTRIARRSPVPLMLALGNHDLQYYRLARDGYKPAPDQSVAGRARAASIRACEAFRDGTYYRFDRQAGGRKYLFLVLDNGYRGTDPRADIKPDPSEITLAVEQVHWLRAQLAAEPDATFILALHVPLGTDRVSQAIDRAFAGCSSLVLILAGHVHSAAVEELVVGKSRALQVRSGAFAQSPTNWRLVKLWEDRIEISQVGQPDRLAHLIPLGAARRPTQARDDASQPTAWTSERPARRPIAVKFQ